jgi:hypothetical protein
VKLNKSPGGQTWLCPEATLDVMLKKLLLRYDFWQKFIFLPTLPEQ